MSANDNSLSKSKNSDPFARRKGPARRHTVGASTTRAEKAEINRALAAAGFPSSSEGAREVLLAWVRGRQLHAANTEAALQPAVNE